MTSVNRDEWSSGLFGCTKDCSSCCLTCWCPCIAFGRIAEILDKGETSCCQMGCFFYLLNVMCYPLGLPGLSWILTMGYRTKLRNHYGIKKGSCPDCLIHCFCQSCALCQEYRELQYQGFDVSAGWEGNAGRGTKGVTLAPVGEGMKR